MSHVAVLCSDIHLSLAAPVARSAEEDWLGVQRRYLHNLVEVADGRPIICAGDIFHKWNSHPELINFALDEVPEMWAVPGQHDLSYHQYEGMAKSAFGTLVRAGRIKLLEPLKPTRIGKHIRAWGFPWGTPLKMMPTFVGKSDSVIDLAVVHAYIWIKGKGFPGAEEKYRLAAYAKALKGFDAAVFGDNHKGFLAGGGESIPVLNHGTFICRASDERDYVPKLGLLHADGSITLKPVDTSADKWLPVEEARIKEEEGHQMKEFLKELESLSADSTDFAEALRGYFKTYEVTEQAQKILLEALDYDVRY